MSPKMAVLRASSEEIRVETKVGEIHLHCFTTT